MPSEPKVDQDVLVVCVMLGDEYTVVCGVVPAPLPLRCVRRMFCE